MKKIGFDGFNIGGLSKIYEVPDGCIKSLEHDYLTGKKILYLKNLDNIMEIYFTPETGGFQEEKTNSNQGDKYSVKITGTIPKADDKNAGTLAYLNHGYHHFAFLDNNGQARFKKNLSFNQVIDTGTEIVGMNGIKFEISGVDKEPAYYITEDILMSL